MEKSTLKEVGVMFGGIAFGSAVIFLLNKYSIESLKGLTPEQALELKGKEFKSDRDGECKAGLFNPIKPGDAQYISCVRGDQGGSRIYTGAVFGNTPISNEITEFRKLATTNGVVDSGYLTFGGLKFEIVREKVLKGGGETNLNLNNCDNKVTIANIGINPKISALYYESIRGKTSTGRICAEIDTPEKAKNKG
jgi:hypothetical protein